MSTTGHAPADVVDREPIEVLEHASPGKRIRDRIPHWWHLLVYLGFSLFVALAIYGGLELRQKAWFYSEKIHFKGDIGNGWRWGNVATKYGLFNLYDRLTSGEVPERRDGVDYPPLRLTVMTRWAEWTQQNFPNARSWQDEYPFTKPLLDFNTTIELASSVFIFLNIRLWRVRMDDAHRAAGVPRRAFIGIAPALFGAMLFWFNPAIIWNGHAWPQWDVWLIPFFLAAVFFGSLDWWFAAGICLVIGAFLKGQMLLGAPILILWPLFGGQLMSVLRLLCGFVFAAACLALPWMHVSSSAWVWIGSMAAAMAFQTPIILNVKMRWYWVVALMIVSLMLAWPWTSDASMRWRQLGPAIASSILLVRFVRPWSRPEFYALALASAVLLTILLFSSSSTWLTMGFFYGAEKFENMLSGIGSWNIPAMLMRYFAFNGDPAQMVNLPLMSEPSPLNKVLFGIYCFFMVLCGVAAALQSRRRDTRFLAAMVTPWLVFFLLLAQMHGRYSLWAAGISALLAGVNTGLGLLGICISIVSLLGILEGQLGATRMANQQVLQTIRNLDPHLGWWYVLIAMTCLYVALAPRRRGTYQIAA